MNNNLILRTLQSPYGDVTKGSVLSHDDVDNNFIFLKGISISTATTVGNNLVLSQINGNSITADLSQIIGTGTTSGGTAGSGTTNYVPKWSNATTLTNSEIFDNGTNIGIGTASPAYKVDVSGIINTNNAVRISTNGAQTGIYGGANQLNFWAGNGNIARYALVGSIAGLSYYTFDGGFTNGIGASGTQTSIRIASNVNSNITANTMNYNQLLINPTYTQSTFGSGDLRGVYYNPTLISLNTSKHIAWENTSGDIVFGNLASSGDGYVLADSNGKLKTSSAPLPQETITVDAVSQYALSGDTAGKMIWVGEDSSASITIVVPANSASTIPINSMYTFVQSTAVQIIFAGVNTGVTVNSVVGNASLIGVFSDSQYSVQYLKKINTDEWLLWGAITT